MNVQVLPAGRLTTRHVSAWSELQRADPAVDNPFFRPEFVGAVATVRDNVEVTVLEQDDRFVGFFPFQRERNNVGRAVAWRMSDMHGIVAARGLAFKAKDLLRASGLSAWHFDHLVASQRLFQPYHSRFDDSPYIDLRDGYDAFVEARRQAGSSAVAQVKRKARKIAREVGPLRFELHTDDHNAFAALLKWKQDQLNRLNCVDVFRFPWIVDLLEVVRSTQTPGFSGMLSALYAGDRLIAVHLGMRSYHVLSSWIPAYDPSFGKYSPGVILHMEMAKSAAAHQIERIDLGRGDNQCKASLASGAIRVAIGSVDRRPMRRMIGAGWYFARDLAHRTPLRGAPLRMYRRMRNSVAHN